MMNNIRTKLSYFNQINLNLNHTQIFELYPYATTYLKSEHKPIFRLSVCMQMEEIYIEIQTFNKRFNGIIFAHVCSLYEINV